MAVAALSMGPVQTGGVATETQYDGAGRATLQASGSVIGGTFTVVESTATQYDAGGTLQWASGNTQDVSSQFIAMASGQTAILDTNGNDVTLASAISGGGSLTKAGSGTLTLTGADTVSGDTTVSGGALMIGATAPTLSFGANQMAQQANPLTAYWGGTFSDPGFGSGFALAYSIDWGDGGPADSGDATIVTRGGPGVPTLGYFADEHTFSAPGTYTGVVTLTDGSGGQTEETFQVAIDAVTASGIADVSVNAGLPSSVIDLSSAFTDTSGLGPDPACAAGDDTSGLGSDLTYTVTGDTNPSLFSSVAIDPSTGQLTLAYAPQAVGSSQLTVRATDSTGDYAEAPFSVTVIDPGTPLYWTPQNNSTSWDPNSLNWNTTSDGSGQQCAVGSGLRCDFRSRQRRHHNRLWHNGRKPNLLRHVRLHDFLRRPFGCRLHRPEFRRHGLDYV